ncbi:ABC transporter permease [Cohnella sp. CIP 111063]|jgi:ABC-2 type transport system permease protein|uniref:ABC transporter permease n=1 Tax=unclassified Cohnella TaxID=2636738 RepID=UPI000B8C093C|nr:MULTISPECIES: ABC transporter permease [unclassified Cohnella]OXS59977.1 ABC transporter permease [Cohnella sp. CIP 111063]PRX72790.1 ABC-2 type transport system permease protein [Cohnella sp. SGD-V74]
MRTRALIARICRQMIRDKRTLALLLAAPLLVLTLMYYILNGGEADNPRIGIVQEDAALAGMLQQAGIDPMLVSEASAATIERHKLDGVLTFEDGRPALLLENADPAQAKALRMKISQIAAFQTLDGLGLPVSASPGIETSYVYGGEESSFFDVLSPILVGFFVFFFVFLISGIGLLRERTTGTLERLMSTPIRRGEVLTGYLAGYGIFAVVQTIIVVMYAVNVLDIPLAGSIWNVLLINLLVALVALSLGILLSTFASSEFQMVQFIPVVVIPQVFFAGILPLDGMANWLQILGKIMPLYYAGDALTGVMYRGEGIGDIVPNLLFLVAFACLFIELNIRALKKYRK